MDFLRDILILTVTAAASKTALDIDITVFNVGEIFIDGIGISVIGIANVIGSAFTRYGEILAISTYCPSIQAKYSD